MNAVYIGTSGFMYKDWKGRFYPLDVPQKRWLSYYASHFNTLEVNATFYGHFKSSVFAHWKEQTPKDFLFTLKGPRFITHVLKLQTVGESLKRFLDSASYLEEKLALILWQFPESFINTEHNIKLIENFLALLPHSPRSVFELRHNSWFTNTMYSLLRTYSTGFVINDTSAFPVKKVITTDIAYIRFHGPQALYASSYSNAQLEYWAEVINQYRLKALVFAYFNNDTSGYAIENAKILQELAA